MLVPLVKGRVLRRGDFHHIRRQLHLPPKLKERQFRLGHHLRAQQFQHLP